MVTLRSLDAPEATDAAAVGGKAAHLAVARAAGLPVPEGWVLPVEASSRAAVLGAEALARSGHAAARLAVAGMSLEAAAERELDRVARGFGGRAIVRSSAPGESDPRWAGAYSSYVDVHPEDMPVAVRGCWASLFSRDVEARCAELDEPPSSLRMAVLVQPLLDLRLGGLARVAGDGRVVVSSVSGSPSGLMAGRRSGRTVEIELGEASPAAPGDAALAAARLAHAVLGATGDDTIEWGMTAAGDVALLQAGRAGSAPAARPRAASGPPPAGAERVALAAARFPGALGEELVMPWVLALDPPPDARPIAIGVPSAALDRARALAAKLSADAWAMPPDVATREALATFSRLRSGDPHARRAAMRRLDALRPVDPRQAMQVLGTILGLGDRLVGSGQLTSAPSIWRIRPDALGSCLRAGERPAPIGGPDRWEPFLFEVVAERGLPASGAPVADGVSAGPVRVIDRRWFRRAPAPREVLVAELPAPHLAPLLWGAAGLVTRRGSLGAHLFEVARSLGVPAVAGVDLPDLRDGRSLAAVDGGEGTVTVLHEDRAAREAMAAG